MYINHQKHLWSYVTGDSIWHFRLDYGATKQGMYLKVNVKLFADNLNLIYVPIKIVFRTILAEYPLNYILQYILPLLNILNILFD